MSSTKTIPVKALAGVALAASLLALTGCNNYTLANLLGDGDQPPTTLACTNLDSHDATFINRIFTDTELSQINASIMADQAARCQKLKDVLSVLRLTRHNVFMERAAIGTAAGMGF